MKLATQISNGAMSLSLIRKAYWNRWHHSFEQQLDFEAQLQSVAVKSSDFKEGVAEFLEKRTAQFKGE